MKNPLGKFRIIFGCIFFLSMPMETTAVPITFTFNATVDVISDSSLISQFISTGDQINGAFTFDSEAPDIVDWSTEIGRYFHYTSYYSSPPYGVTANIAGVYFETEPSKTIDDYGQPIALDVSVSAINTATGSYAVRSGISSQMLPGIDLFFMVLFDYQKDAILSEELPLVPPDLSLIEDSVIFLSGSGGVIQGTIQNLIVSSIPEPSVMAVLIIGGLALVTIRLFKRSKG